MRVFIFLKKRVKSSQKKKKNSVEVGNMFRVQLAETADTQPGPQPAQ